MAVRGYRHKHRMLQLEKNLKEEGFEFIAGVDESGRGPLAGPVVGCAVVLKETSFSVAIKDCKQLTHLARERAFDEILKRSYVGVSVVEREKIDKLNILEASLLAMRQAVCSLKIKPDCLLVDGPYRISEDVKNVSVIKGDVYSLSVACASIVAKVVRDRIMHKLDSFYPAYGFEHNKGYGTKKHLESIKKFGPSPFHRLSFFPFARRQSKREYFAKRKKELPV